MEQNININIADLEEVGELLPSDEIPVHQSRIKYDYNNNKNIVTSDTHKVTLASLLKQTSALQNQRVTVNATNTNSVILDNNTNTIAVDLPTKSIVEFNSKVAQLDELQNEYQQAILEISGVVSPNLTKDDLIRSIDVNDSADGGIDIATSKNNNSLVSFRLNSYTIDRLLQLESLVNKFDGDLQNLVDAVNLMQYNNNKAFLTERYNFINNKIRYLPWLLNHSFLLLEINPNMEYIDGEESNGGVKYIECIRAKYAESRAFNQKSQYGIAYNQNGVSNIALPQIKSTYTYKVNNEQSVDCLRLGIFTVPNYSSYYFTKNNSKVNILSEFCRNDLTRRDSNQAIDFTVILGYKVNDFKSYLSGSSIDNKHSLCFIGREINAATYNTDELKNCFRVDVDVSAGIKVDVIFSIGDLQFSKKLKLPFNFNTNNSEEDVLLLFAGFNNKMELFVSACVYSNEDDKSNVIYASLPRSKVQIDNMKSISDNLDSMINDNKVHLSIFNTAGNDNTVLKMTHFGIIDKFCTNINNVDEIVKTIFFDS